MDDSDGFPCVYIEQKCVRLINRGKSERPDKGQENDDFTETMDDNDKHYTLGPPKWNLRFSGLILYGQTPVTPKIIIIISSARKTFF